MSPASTAFFFEDFAGDSHEFEVNVGEARLLPRRLVEFEGEVPAEYVHAVACGRVFAGSHAFAVFEDDVTNIIVTLLSRHFFALFKVADLSLDFAAFSVGSKRNVTLQVKGKFLSSRLRPLLCRSAVSVSVAAQSCLFSALPKENRRSRFAFCFLWLAPFPCRPKQKAGSFSACLYPP